MLTNLTPNPQIPHYAIPYMYYLEHELPTIDVFKVWTLEKWDVCLWSFYFLKSETNKPKWIGKIRLLNH